MNERTRRVLITVAVLCLAAGIFGIVVMRGRSAPSSTDATPAATQPPSTPAGTAEGATGATATQPPAANGTPATPTTTQASAPSGAGATPATPSAAPAPAQPAAQVPLTARAPGAVLSAPVVLGSLDWRSHKFQLVISPKDVGMTRVVFSQYWRTAEQNRQAQVHWTAVESGADTIPALPPVEDRYTLSSPGKLGGFEVSLMAARNLEVDGQLVNLYGDVWSQTGPAEFATSIVDDSGAEQLRVTRRYVVGSGFDIGLEQRVTNVSPTPRKVVWIQNGPPDLGREPGQLVETRRFQSGYLMNAERDPSQRTVIVHGTLLDHSQVLKDMLAGNPVVWPNEQQTLERYGLSWFGSTNRYFALAVHAPYAPPTSSSKLIAPTVQTVMSQYGEAVHDGKPERVVYTYTRSAPTTVQPGAAAAFDVGVFAGPLDRVLLKTTEPFAALNMQGLILYLMSGCCSWCTFAWLADFLIALLAMLRYYVVFDWALAIIVLVIAVRLVLHPLTRRSQIAMQRVSRQMQALKPELDALKTRYKDDPKKIQEEQIRLYREHQINPLGCAGGMLPTFLQMPIWIALYAMLYFAFELRQTPAFFGIFQNFGGWGFLGDLSAPDSFIPLGTTINLYIITFSSINLIPILMGVIFYLQQKYMTPPTTTQLTPEQEQQQKIMKWMMVILFPLMLYSAPSGLTLYIATSTLVGVFESMRVRKEVEKMDFSKRPQKGKGGWLQRAMERAMERAQAAQATQQQPPQGGGRPKPPSRPFKHR
jgi:YidC/Oxa1 family membrane protein insertase